ncbi:UDP-4-amino-4,6-dideoxy-N-acetyl-beta-L-altrosamine N-acetyltransferase [Helicobacter cappadocius]|uniref:UDP-4-amino-4, 6-dideoxy-N-acetyl-beta-L-altrosamine N-acetyltransferase n=1 Tax=Helicobacter cappadocius TaxID=3063998 RepID=A0AA90T5A4_9HELI|nr:MULTISPECIES: UDP-4-amino-4,6-dideoxy-N-acetyl-beta-L-altrosamine N-acetyltransferase [unclassified Helicobacter]MDO7253357.1 UDP-4-amino-4,6-dideoxy-N-acetyl-beta-L-altrosamine N-acetyltransferase [Helicobacter sp. faydin-H75]MDP2539213.1 UDP-4-amino-4,6-dideoxy-N-acetyl-beta-L-altrosamine N-acetyltransferase [Helicobacter sp. faydin-H76]
MNFYIHDIYALHFTQMDEKDSQSVLEFRNHPEISKWMYSRNISKKAHLDFISSLKNNPLSHYWLIKRGSLLLGVGSITRVNFTHKHAYLGIYKNPCLQNVGTEILKCLESIAFVEFELHTLHLEVLESNRKAIGFYKRHDYIYEGKLLDFIFRDNKYENVLIYGKRKNND